MDESQLRIVVLDESFAPEICEEASDCLPRRANHPSNFLMCKPEVVFNMAIVLSASIAEFQ